MKNPKMKDFSQFFLCIGIILSVFQLIQEVESYGSRGNGEKVRGVNLGGWLVLEKWITPALFNGLPSTVVDEYTLCQFLGKEKAGQLLRAHWDSWVTEQEISTLKDAGVNHLRIPVGYWAMEIPEGEPWVSGSWDFAVRAVGWAKKYGLSVMIDLHGAPGSQNGFDNSGRQGDIRFFYNQGNLDLANRVVTRIAEWANAPDLRDTVRCIQLLNEPVLWGNDYNMRLGKLKDYYGQAYHSIRRVNENIVVTVHDAFISADNWFYFRDLPEYRWVMLDTHIYQVFNPAWTNWTCAEHAKIPCNYFNSLPTSENKLWTVVGEWSLATPHSCSNQAELARQQIGVYERSSGWFFWNFKHGAGWREWDFLASVREGWINLHQNNYPQC